MFGTTTITATIDDIQVINVGNTGGGTGALLWLDAIANSALQPNKKYKTESAARLDLTLPSSASNGDIIEIFDNSSGFRIYSGNVLIEELTTSVNGYIDSMKKGTKVTLEKSLSVWILTVQSGWIQFS